MINKKEFKYCKFCGIVVFGKGNKCFRCIQSHKLPPNYCVDCGKELAGRSLRCMECKKVHTKHVHKIYKEFYQKEVKAAKNLCIDCGEPTQGKKCRACYLLERRKNMRCKICKTPTKSWQIYCKEHRFNKDRYIKAVETQREKHEKDPFYGKWNENTKILRQSKIRLIKPKIERLCLCCNTPLKQKRLKIYCIECKRQISKWIKIARKCVVCNKTFFAIGHTAIYCKDCQTQKFQTANAKRWKENPWQITINGGNFDFITVPEWKAGVILGELGIPLEYCGSGLVQQEGMIVYKRKDKYSKKGVVRSVDFINRKLKIALDIHTSWFHRGEVETDEDRLEKKEQIESTGYKYSWIWEQDLSTTKIERKWKSLLNQ